MLKTEGMLIGAITRLGTWLGTLLGLTLLCLFAATSMVVEASSASAPNAVLPAANAPSVVRAAATPTPNAATTPNAVAAPAAIPTQPPPLAGVVTYRTSSTKIAGVTVAVAGPSSIQDITDAGGNYEVVIGADGLHTVTPSLSGQVNGITSFDAAYIAQCATGLRALSDCPMLAADTSGNNVLSSFDAALIAQYAAGLAGPNSRVGRWVFNPANRSYNTGTTPLLNENYAGYLIGEVSGNWQPAPVTAAQQPNAAARTTDYQQYLPLVGN